MSGVLVLAVLTSVLVAVFRSGQIRATAIGFTVFSLGFLPFEGGFWPNKGNSPIDTFVGWSFDKLHPRPQTDSSIPAEDPFGPRQWIDRYHAYKSICIATVALGMGFVGSAIAQMLHRTAQASNP